jgi:hypothetical protein
MMTTLQLADRFFKNAASFSARCQTLPRFEQVDALTVETGRWFGALAGDEGDAVTLKRRLWRLRATAQLTLMPFDNPDLLLQEECKEITALARFYPALVQRRDQLVGLVDALVKSTENPKRVEVFKRLSEYQENNRSVGLVAALTRGRVPGWPSAFLVELGSLFPDLEIITSKAGIDQSSFDRIILPSGGRLCPFLRDLHFCGFTETLEFIAYRSEAVSIQERPNLPSGTLKMESIRHEPTTGQSVASDEVAVASDSWMQQRFWASARSELTGGAFANGTQFRVRARLVILANIWKTFLEDDSKVLEVSEVLIHGEGAHDAVQKLPRRRVSELKAGHLIALRTSGSGGYLISVADALLRSAGRGRLRAEALEWKSYLAEALVNHGTAKVAKLLEQKHHFLANHRYIEIWTTNRVIRPEKEGLFRDLMVILGALKCLPPGSDTVSLADKYWAQMRELVHFHLMAGNKIRSALLQELRRIIDSGEKVGDEMSITLRGVDAGQLSLYRVSDVDSEVIEVPYTELEVLRHLEG